MSESPAFRGPIDPKEQPILDRLLLIRDELLLLKSDRSKYVKSHDVIKLYDQVLEQIGALNDIRSTKREEQNRLDTVLDDCLQLISLFFLTVGRNAEAPAAYSTTSTIKRLLDHLKEAGFFSSRDLTGLEHHLNKIQASVEQGQEHHSPHIILLLTTRIDNCKATLKDLKSTLSTLPPDLAPTHEKLVSILRTLSGLNLKPKFPVEQLKEYQRQLEDIRTSLGIDPHILSEQEKSAEDQYEERLKSLQSANTHLTPPTGKQIVEDLLGRVILWSEIMEHKRGKFATRFHDTFDELLNIYRQLEKLSLTQAWSLRETDLYGYQRRLDRVDESRVDGNFIDPTGRTASIFEQRALLYLLRKGYATIFFMLTNSEPVSEALLPVYNQLTTLRRCLVEVKKNGGVGSPRELYPYSMKLNSIDNMRHDGKFMVNGDIPEGQGSVNALLAECFELAYELRNDAEREENDEEASSADEEDQGSRRHRDLNGGDDDDVDDFDPDDSEETGNKYGDPMRRSERAHSKDQLISDSGSVGEAGKGMAGLTIDVK